MPDRFIVEQVGNVWKVTDTDADTVGYLSEAGKDLVLDTGILTIAVPAPTEQETS